MLPCSAFILHLVTTLCVVMPRGRSASRISLDYSYDAAGNIFKEQKLPKPESVSLPAVTMTYTAANRLATYNGQAVQFDADGNRVSGPLSGEMAKFRFDSRNRLISAGETSYRYDAENQRIGVNQTSYVINSQPALSQVLVKEEKGGKTFYIYGLGLLGEEKDGEYRAYHFDFRGSTVALSDNAGKVVQGFQYGLYGELLNGEATVTPFLFNGKFGVMTEGNGLYYMRARYYSAEVKRFVNMDVLLGTPSKGQTLNRFAYGIGNSINRINPTGYFAWVIIPVIPSIIEAIAATTEVMIVVAGTISVASISGDTPITQTHAKSSAVSRTENGRVILFHGTDITSALALLNGAPLEVDKVIQLRHDVGDVGFYRATDIAVAEHFAVVRGMDGTVLQYIFTQQATNELVSAGCMFRPITPGKNFNPPGLEFLVPPTALELFNLLRNSRQIIVTPAP